MKKAITTPKLKKQDPELNGILEAEEAQQLRTIDLTASQNFTSPAVRETLTWVGANRYSEGYPGKRYYPANENIDNIELLAQRRALELFGLNNTEWGVNVQALSGVAANIAIYSALLKDDDVALGMRLADGGHLSHGHKASRTSRFFNFIQYGITKEGVIDYDEIERLAQDHKPKIIVAGASAYSIRVDFAAFAKIAKRHNALLVADISHIAGLIVAGLHPSPFPYCDAVMSTTHKTLRGPRGALIFGRSELMGAINRSVFPGLQGGPHNNQTAAIAVALKEAQDLEFRAYAGAIVKNAKKLAGELMKKGYIIVAGGTENHLMLIDLNNKGLDGKEASERLANVGIIANANTIPGDKNALKPSGIRLGTPMVTTRGMGWHEMQAIARFIDETLQAKTENDCSRIKKDVEKLAKHFPPPGFE